jgi:hypothetical protein
MHHIPPPVGIHVLLSNPRIYCHNCNKEFGTTTRRDLDQPHWNAMSQDRSIRAARYVDWCSELVTAESVGRASNTRPVSSPVILPVIDWSSPRFPQSNIYTCIICEIAQLPDRDQQRCFSTHLVTRLLRFLRRTGINEHKEIKQERTEDIV